MGGGRCGHVCSRQTVPVHVELSFSLSSYEFPFLGLEEVRNGHRQGKRARVERAPSRSPRQAVSEGPSWWLPWERESQEETGSISSAVWPGATSQDTTLLGPCTLRKEASCWDHREQVNCCGSGLTGRQTDDTVFPRMFSARPLPRNSRQTSAMDPVIPQESDLTEKTKSIINPVVMNGKYLLKFCPKS